MSGISSKGEFTIPDEWLQLPDERDKDIQPVRKGRARSNSFCITSTNEEISFPLILSPEETLYFRTKDILSHIPPPIVPLCAVKTECKYAVAFKGDESLFLKSTEYSDFANRRKPSLRVTFLNYSETNIRDLLSFFPAEHLSQCCSGQSSIDYYLMVTNEKSLSFNLILCVVHQHCAECIKSSILKSSHMNVLLIDMIDDERMKKIDMFLNKYNTKPASIIGVKGKNSITEPTLRSRLSKNAQFSYFEASFKNKKRMARIVESITQLVIQSQYNMSEINSANCIILVSIDCVL